LKPFEAKGRQPPFNAGNLFETGRNLGGIQEIGPNSRANEVIRERISGAVGLLVQKHAKVARGAALMAIRIAKEAGLPSFKYFFPKSLKRTRKYSQNSKIGPSIVNIPFYILDLITKKLSHFPF